MNKDFPDCFVDSVAKVDEIDGMLKDRFTNYVLMVMDMDGNYIRYSNPVVARGMALEIIDYIESMRREDAS